MASFELSALVSSLEVRVAVGLCESLRNIRVKLSHAIVFIAVATMAMFHSSVVSAHPAKEYVAGEVIVKLKGSSQTLQSQAFIGSAVSVKGMTLKRSWSAMNMHHFTLKPGESVETTVANLANDPNVAYAEPNYIVHRSDFTQTSEPVAMSEVYAQDTPNETYAQTSAPIQVPDGWAAETSGLAPIVVAVIDTGLDLTHPVFVNSGAIWTNPGEIANNGIDDDGNGFIDDVHGWNFVSNTNSPQDDDGHGTHCSGIILGVTLDITQNPIAAAKIRIMPVKFLDENGSGTTADGVDAIYYAINNGAKVLSNSWGGGSYSNALAEAIAFGYSKQVAFAAAAGNASNNNDSNPTYPANYQVPNVMSVAATVDDDTFASFSNYGVTTVHLGSPGVNIWSTLPGGMYGRASGTSMATPFVAGVAALVMREQPEITGYQAKTYVLGAAQQISSLVGLTITQARLNSYLSIMAVKGQNLQAEQPAFNAASVERDPASDGTTTTTGCGLVAKSIYDGKGGPDGMSGPQKNLAFFAILIILLSPLFLSAALRNREPKTGISRRKHERYQMSSAVTMKFGDRELVGQVSQISVGGVQLNTDAWLENGGIVKMSIASPDGKDQIEVQGHIVWSEQQKRYGVAFDNADESLKATISRWTSSLLKA
jgi:subtilisin family serine protease